jgi:hypothetical protein
VSGPTRQESRGGKSLGFSSVRLAKGADLRFSSSPDNIESAVEDNHRATAGCGHGHSGMAIQIMVESDAVAYNGKGSSGKFGYGSDSGFISGGEQIENATGQFRYGRLSYRR